MSTFAVFGMNEHFAREEAKRKVRDFKIEKGQRIELSMSQWLQAVALHYCVNLLIEPAFTS